MNTTTGLVALIAATLAVTGCSDSDDDSADNPDNTTTCTDLFAPGRPTADVLADYDTNPCTIPDGDTTSPPLSLIVDWPCPDGTHIRYVEGWGWGRDGQTWQQPPAQTAGLIEQRSTLCSTPTP